MLRDGEYTKTPEEILEEGLSSGIYMRTVRDIGESSGSIDVRIKAADLFKDIYEGRVEDYNDMNDRFFEIIKLDKRY